MKPVLAFTAGFAAMLSIVASLRANLAWSTLFLALCVESYVAVRKTDSLTAGLILRGTGAFAVEVSV